MFAKLQKLKSPELQKDAAECARVMCLQLWGPGGRLQRLSMAGWVGQVEGTQGTSLGSQALRTTAQPYVSTEWWPWGWMGGAQGKGLRP